MQMKLVYAYFHAKKQTWGPSGAKHRLGGGGGGGGDILYTTCHLCRRQISWKGTDHLGKENERCQTKGEEIDRMRDLLLHSHSSSHWTTEETILESVILSMLYQK